MLVAQLATPPAALQAMGTAPQPVEAASAASIPVPPLRFIAPTNHAMPFVGFKQGALSTGLLKDIGDEMARRLGRRADYLVVPPRRVSQLLLRGEADALCYAAPGWIDGRFHWSPPLMAHAGVVAAHPASPALGSLRDLAGLPLGTVYDYRYAEFEETLGPRFVRDDAPSMEANLRKLSAGRFRYALTEEVALQYHNKRHPQAPLMLALRTRHYPTFCAFSLAHALPLPALDRAVAEMVRDGTLERILDRYR